MRFLFVGSVIAANFLLSTSRDANLAFGDELGATSSTQDLPPLERVHAEYTKKRTDPKTDA